MKNTYKWRASNIKYLYITDVDNAGPFIYNKKDGTKTFATHVTTTNVEETLIKHEVSKLGFEQFSTLFNQMVILAQKDADCANIRFADVSYYYNTDGDTCSELPPSVPCDCYTPKWEVKTVRKPYDYEGPYSKIENVEVISSTKEIIYYLTLYIPEGQAGKTSGPGPMGPRGFNGEDGKNAKITYIGATTYTADSGTPASVSILSGGTEENLELYFEYVIPKGEKGEQGVQGDVGDSGADAEIGNVTIDVESLEWYETAQALVSADTRYNEYTNTNVTDLNFDFKIPKGEQGIQGPKGEPAKFYKLTANVVTLLPGQNATVEIASGVTSVQEYDEEGLPYVDEQYWMNFNFGIPRGEKGEQGAQGIQGEPGDTEYIEGGGGGDTPSYNFTTAKLGLVTDPDPDVIGYFKEEPSNNQTYVSLILDESIIGGGGGRKYCPGDGIEFIRDSESGCTRINANTEATIVSDIECGDNAPIDASGIWSGDTIPQGTTVQEILEKLLTGKELYPSKPNLPNIDFYSLDEPLVSGNTIDFGMVEIGTQITIPRISLSTKNGVYNAEYGFPSQPSPIITWHNPEINVDLVNKKGFDNTGYVPEYSNLPLPTSTANVTGGENELVFEGYYEYTKPVITSGYLPLSNKGNETLSTSEILLDDSDMSLCDAIWDDGTAQKKLTVKAKGVFPLYTNVNGNILQNNVSEKLPLSDTDTIVIENVPSEVVNGYHFALDFPRNWELTLIEIKMTGGDFVPFDGEYNTLDKQHEINGVTYNYTRFITGKNQQTTSDNPLVNFMLGVSSYRLTFSRPEDWLIGDILPVTLS